jgi:hypothetical protein
MKVTRYIIGGPGGWEAAITAARGWGQNSLRAARRYRELPNFALENRPIWKVTVTATATKVPEKRRKK